ncbi:MAG TPA: ribosome biogenesis GTP-binding protein YihA/YsxC [Stenomitos sp.]
MKITSAELAATAVQPSQYPKPIVPAIAFVGRSNVGKSSLINCLLNRKSLARTSATPGKTATINFYRVNRAFDLVDLPGYGYAEVSRAKKGQWAKMIDEFLLNFEHLHGVIQIIDLRHPPSDLDVQMFEWLQAEGIPTTVVATKADKLGRSKWEAHRKVCAEALLLTEAPREALLVASSELGESRDRIWTRIGAYLAQEPLRLEPASEEPEEADV